MNGWCMMPAVAAACLLAGPARAEDRPALTPSRDADITYRMLPPPDAQTDGPVLEQRMRWDVKDRKLRVDPPAAGLYMLIDLAARQITMVRAADRTLLVLPQGAATLPGETQGGNFTRRGTDTVAGLGCTEWDTQDSAGQPTTVCISPDGVLLRARSGPRLIVEAVRVTFAPQASSVFTPPAGYDVVSPPAGG